MNIDNILNEIEKGLKPITSNSTYQKRIRNNKTAFIIDDSGADREKTRNVLQEMGYKISGEARDFTSTMTGLNGIEKATTVSPAVITLNVRTDNATQNKLLQEITNHYPESKVIMVSGQANQSTVLNCIQNGAKGFVLQPLTKEKMEKSISQIKGSS